MEARPSGKCLKMCIRDSIGHGQTDDAGNGRGAQEVHHRLPAHSTHFFHVIHGQDAVDHGDQHHRNHDELEQVYKNVAKGLDVIGRDVFQAHSFQNNSHRDAQQQGDEDLYRQADSLLHGFHLSHIVPFQPWYTHCGPNQIAWPL